MPDRTTVPSVRARKRASGSEPIVMVTAYDTPTAAAADTGGVDIVLVGDSMANVVLGYPDTLHVDVATMAHHVGAVHRAGTRALVVADMPWLSYHLEPTDAVRNAAVLVRAGAEAVKLEGGAARVPAIRAIVAAEIPVMGHLGLTPQSVHAMGGYRVQARDDAAAAALVDDARALQAAGCFAVVLEGVPDVAAAAVTDALSIPTIGIGAGPACDGQVLVFHDLVGYGTARPAKFVRRYAELFDMASAAVAAWAADVRAGSFPADAETYHAVDRGPAPAPGAAAEPASPGDRPPGGGAPPPVG